MTISFIKAKDPEQLSRLLNGLVLSKKNLSLGRDLGPRAMPGDLYKHPVAGLTLIFTTPGFTVTFSANLDLKHIVAEINTAAGKDIAHLIHFDDNGGQVLAIWDDTTPVVMLSTGTANTYFGFSTTVADPHLTQTATDPDNIVAIVVEILSRQYVAFIKG
jgi:hypothetical protein